jgi:hypothetical protein
VYPPPPCVELLTVGDEGEAVSAAAAAFESVVVGTGEAVIVICTNVVGGGEVSAGVSVSERLITLVGTVGMIVVVVELDGIAVAGMMAVVDAAEEIELVSGAGSVVVEGLVINKVVVVVSVVALGKIDGVVTVDDVKAAASVVASVVAITEGVGDVVDMVLLLVVEDLVELEAVEVVALARSMEAIDVVVFAKMLEVEGLTKLCVVVGGELAALLAAAWN